MEVRGKKLTQEQIDYHASLIGKQVKKKRRCVRGCGKVFMSRDSGHRVCDECARSDNFGVLAEAAYVC